LLSVLLSFLLLSNWFLFLSSFIFRLLFRHCFIPVSLACVVSYLAYPNLLGTKRLGCCCWTYWACLVNTHGHRRRAQASDFRHLRLWFVPDDRSCLAEAATKNTHYSANNRHRILREKTMDSAMICSTEHKEDWLAVVLWTNVWRRTGMAQRYCFTSCVLGPRFKSA
jgi:hypothetical protein